MSCSSRSDRRRGPPGSALGEGRHAPVAAILEDPGPHAGATRTPRALLYLGLTLLWAGVALWPLLLLAPLLGVMHRGVITREERYLGGKFGDAYRRYRARVRRWGMQR